jgi:outer membrane protein OmpA-like peptidoglycan-associated protein
MKMKWLQIGFLCAAGLASQAQAAEETFSVGNKAAPLTNQGGTARAMAMGSAFVGVAEGSESLMWNPAGLGTLCGNELALHHTSGIGDSIREIGIFAMPVRSLGAFAAAIDAASNGSFEGRDTSGNQTGNYHASSAGARLGWGKEIFSRLSLGGVIKMNHQDLAGSTYSSYMGDLGVLWNPFTTLKFGATYANLNIANSYTDTQLNSAWHLGASFSPIQPLLLAMAGELQPGGVKRMQFGGELSPNGQIALRGGYQFNYPNADLGGWTNFTVGLGLKVTQRIHLDYAFVPEGDLGAAHRISLIYKFDCAKEKEVMTEAAPVPPVTEKVIVLQDTHFDFDKSTLTPEAQKLLDEDIKVLLSNPNTFIRIAGYTWAAGTDEYNQKLSERRAASVQEYLRKGGIPNSRVAVIGYGEASPKTHESDQKDVNSKAAKSNMRTLFEIVVK